MATIHCIAPESVSQKDLETVIGLRNQIEMLQEMYDREVGAILSRLLSGCAVERGLHQVKTDQENRGPERIIRLMVNGRPA